MQDRSQSGGRVDGAHEFCLEVECPVLSFVRCLMLWTLLLILLLMWALGIGFSVGGNLIHILLVVALVILILNLLQGRRAIG